MRSPRKIFFIFLSGVSFGFYIFYLWNYAPYFRTSDRLLASLGLGFKSSTVLSCVVLPQLISVLAFLIARKVKRNWKTSHGVAFVALLGACAWISFYFLPAHMAIWGSGPCGTSVMMARTEILAFLQVNLIGAAPFHCLMESI